MFRRNVSLRASLPALTAAILLTTSPLLFVTAASAQTALGSIQGRVVDQDFQPIAGAQVYPITGPSGTGSSNSALTNADGRFRLESLAPGSYTLSVSKVSDGYADPSQRFYSVTNRATASVSVSSATQSPEVVLQMGRRCGTLHVLAEDAVTHRPLQQITYTLRVANAQGDMLQGDKPIPADFLVPPVDVTVEFFAKGYSNWRYSENGHDFLTLRPGESRTLQVEMQPQPASDTTNAAH